MVSNVRILGGENISILNFICILEIEKDNGEEFHMWYQPVIPLAVEAPSITPKKMDSRLMVEGHRTVGDCRLQYLSSFFCNLGLVTLEEWIMNLRVEVGMRFHGYEMEIEPPWNETPFKKGPSKQ
ncbi:uncharacterized protein [Spinacia oleracea]|uniref:Uncharacterized protein n=1 Tax=Spinacia oleracea TaxID=3562 RepID=A0A9R0JFZ2_SPIOL|nr:uncharacterized protein LOC110804946 [Spinacia oleracea]